MRHDLRAWLAWLLVAVISIQCFTATAETRWQAAESESEESSDSREPSSEELTEDLIASLPGVQRLAGQSGGSWMKLALHRCAPQLHSVATPVRRTELSLRNGLGGPLRC